MDDTSEIIETEESQPNTNDVYHTMFADYPDIVGAEQLCDTPNASRTQDPSGEDRGNKLRSATRTKQTVKTGQCAENRELRLVGLALYYDSRYN